MARVFPFILRAKHKTLHVIWAWAKLENSVEKKSAQTLIDRADLHSKSYSTLNSNFTYKHNLSQWQSHVGAKGGLGPPKFLIKKLVDIFVNSDPSKFILGPLIPS